MKFIAFIFIALCLSACESFLVTDIVAAPGGVLFQDGFSDPSSGWPRVSNSSGNMDYGDNGTYGIQVNSSNYDLWAVSGHAYRDVRVDVDATRSAGPDENRYGVICRYKDPQNFYFFIITSDGYEAIGKVKRGVQVLLDQDMMAYSPAVVTGNGPNHLRFDCIGQTLTGYVNNEAIEVVQDADFPNGDAGLIAGAFDQPGVFVTFDNFMVIKP